MDTSLRRLLCCSLRARYAFLGSACIKALCRMHSTLCSRAAGSWGCLRLRAGGGRCLVSGELVCSIDQAICISFRACLSYRVRPLVLSAALAGRCQGHEGEASDFTSITSALLGEKGGRVRVLKRACGLSTHAIVLLVGRLSRWRFAGLLAPLPELHHVSKRVYVL
jgi:hypothetical protein